MSSSSSSTFPIGAKVWVKMPEYPWWPGFVIDAGAMQVDTSLRTAEQDVCVQCLPNTAASIMFVSSSNASEIRAYGGLAADKELIAAGQAHPECALAVEEALLLFEADSSAAQLDALGSNAEVDDAFSRLMEGEAATAAAAQKPAEAKGAGALSSSSDDDDEDDMDEEEKMLLQLGSAAPDADVAMAAAAASDGGEAEQQREERRRQRKLEKKAAKAARRKAEKEKEKGKNRRKKREREGGNRDGGEEDDDDDNDRYENSASKGKSKLKKTKTSDPRDLRQTSLDGYVAEAARPPKVPAFKESDDAYYRRRLQKRRHTVSDAVLLEYVAKLRDVTGECLESGTYAEEEPALLELLRVVAAYDVTYEQLRSTGIGAAVGALLKSSFPVRVRELGHGILSYWFRALPQNVQQDLSADCELDRCSVETTAGARSDGMEGALGAVGVHLYESFTDEEINDAPLGTNVAEICHEIETMLRENKDDIDARVSVFSAIGEPANTRLRRAILDGHVTPRDILNHADDPVSLVSGGVTARGLPRIRTDFSGSVGSPTTPYSPFSPTGFGRDTAAGFTSPAGGTGGLGTFTTLYTCPSCGAAEAYRTEYTVQAHDNYPEILRCRKCDEVWNVAE